MCCVCVVCVLCFFQAEDGIRDLVRSRGLGDVYKRQHERMRRMRSRERDFAQDRFVELYKKTPRIAQGDQPVSYTHLTLPTSDLV